MGARLEDTAHAASQSTVSIQGLANPSVQRTANPSVQQIANPSVQRIANPSVQRKPIHLFSGYQVLGGMVDRSQAQQTLPSG